MEMMMRKIKKIVVPAKGETVLEPKGYHIMFIKLKQPLTLESEFPLTLTFKESGKTEVDVSVIPPGKKPKTTKGLLPETNSSPSNHTL